MFRVGIVKAQDTTNARVRVTFPDHDQMQSWWLPVVMLKTQNDKSYWIPDIGEQVVCLMDAHDEDGAVLGAVYSATDMPTVNSADKFHEQFRDGASFEYDRASHALAVRIPSGGMVSISAGGASITLDVSGNVKIVSGASGQIQLGSGTLIGVARLGDQMQVHDDEEGATLSGTIVSASTNVYAD